MIITLCGSQNAEHFVSEMKNTERRLIAEGHTVYSPDTLGPEKIVTEKWYQDNYGREKFLELKPVWTKTHFKKIEKSDAVLIMNHEKKGIRGYFGSNTLMELSVAFYLEKKIYFLNPIGEDHPHYEEIIGLKPTVLNGDLANLG